MGAKHPSWTRCSFKAMKTFEKMMKRYKLYTFLWGRRENIQPWKKSCTCPVRTLTSALQGKASSRVAWVSTPLLVVVRQDLRDHLDRRHNSSHTSQAYSNPYLSKMVLPRMLPSFFEGPTRLSSSLSSKARPEIGVSLERVPRVPGTSGFWKYMF